MAAINFPDAPTNGQIFESGGMSWTYVAGIGWTLNSAIVEAGSGFTFIADTMPLPVNVGDTWFDSSIGASGGTSWVAVEEGPAGASEKVWVQFAPGTASLIPDSVSNGHLANMPASTFKGNNTGAVADPKDLTIAEMRAALKFPKAYMNEFQTAGFTSNGQPIDFSSLFSPVVNTGYVTTTAHMWVHSGSVSQAYSLVIRSTTTGQVQATGVFEQNIQVPVTALGDWYGCSPAIIGHTLSAGQKPNMSCDVFVGSPGSLWYFAVRVIVVEYPS